MIALVVTIGLTFVGYVATCLNGLRLSQRQERLARLNRQLSDFYGPLFALTEANSRSFHAFKERNARPDGRSPLVRLVCSGSVAPTDPMRLRLSGLVGHSVR